MARRKKNFADVDEVIGAGRRYQDALEDYTEAVKTGGDVRAMKRKMTAERKDFRKAITSKVLSQR